MSSALIPLSSITSYDSNMKSLSIYFFYCIISNQNLKLFTILRNNTLPFLSSLIANKTSESIRGVSDVGFPIFADTDADADFAF